MKKDLEVILTNQSFREACGIEQYANLEIVGVVIAILSKDEDQNYRRNFENINKLLVERAKTINAQYVFNVVYKFRNQPISQTCVPFMAIGTAYKIKLWVKLNLL